MGRRGPKPKRIISESWSPGLAYAIGLLTTDGCLATGAPLVDLTSKDRDQLANFNKALGTNFYIGIKKSGAGKKSYRIQIKNVLFYTFLLSVGLTPVKSKSVSKVRIPKKYYVDFLRGVFDGDGYSYSYYDRRWPASYMCYAAISSSSPTFIEWLRIQTKKTLGIQGHITVTPAHHYQLKYAKKEAIRFFQQLYSNQTLPYLRRKRLKIERMLRIVGVPL